MKIDMIAFLDLSYRVVFGEKPNTMHCITVTLECRNIRFHYQYPRYSILSHSDRDPACRL